MTSPPSRSHSANDEASEGRIPVLLHAGRRPAPRGSVSSGVYETLDILKVTTVLEPRWAEGHHDGLPQARAGTRESHGRCESSLSDMWGDASLWQFANRCKICVQPLSDVIVEIFAHVDVRSTFALSAISHAMRRTCNDREILLRRGQPLEYLFVVANKVMTLGG